MNFENNFKIWVRIWMMESKTALEVQRTFVFRRAVAELPRRTVPCELEIWIISNLFRFFVFVTKCFSAAPLLHTTSRKSFQANPELFWVKNCVFWTHSSATISVFTNYCFEVFELNNVSWTLEIVISAADMTYQKSRGSVSLPVAKFPGLSKLPSTKYGPQRLTKKT